MSKIIVITGAGVGLGRAVARRFVADGESVVLLGRTASKVEAAAKELGERALAIQCDVSSPESVKAAFAVIAERHPKVDVLINNAAIFQPFKIADATDDQILKIVNTNLTGPILCVRAAIPMMGRGSHIINVGSESVDMTFPHLVLYQSTKAGLARLTKGLYHELEPSGIRVTEVRAGSMYEEGKAWDADPAAQMAFGKACMEAGINLMQRPISHMNSVTGIFRALIDLPPDVHVESVCLHGWAAT